MLLVYIYIYTQKTSIFMTPTSVWTCLFYTNHVIIACAISVCINGVVVLSLLVLTLLGPVFVVLLILSCHSSCSNQGSMIWCVSLST